MLSILPTTVALFVLTVQCVAGSSVVGAAPPCTAFFNIPNATVSMIPDPLANVIVRCHLGFENTDGGQGWKKYNCSSTISNMTSHVKPGTLPTCDMIVNYCPMIRTTMFILGTGSGTIGTVETKRCQPGYVGFGAPSFTCGKSNRTTGTWMGNGGCVAVQCQAPPELASPLGTLPGQYLYNSTMYGAVATLACSAGYQLRYDDSTATAAASRSRVITCQANGRWSNGTATCDGVGPDLYLTLPPGNDTEAVQFVYGLCVWDANDERLRDVTSSGAHSASKTAFPILFKRMPPGYYVVRIEDVVPKQTRSSTRIMYGIEHNTTEDIPSIPSVDNMWRSLAPPTKNEIYVIKMHPNPLQYDMIRFRLHNPISNRTKTIETRMSSHSVAVPVAEIGMTPSLYTYEYWKNADSQVVSLPSMTLAFIPASLPNDTKDAANTTTPPSQALTGLIQTTHAPSTPAPSKKNVTAATKQPSAFPPVTDSTSTASASHPPIPHGNLPTFQPGPQTMSAIMNSTITKTTRSPTFPPASATPFLEKQSLFSSSSLYILVGGGVGALLLLAMIWFFYRRRTTKKVIQDPSLPSRLARSSKNDYGDGKPMNTYECYDSNPPTGIAKTRSSAESEFSTATCSLQDSKAMSRTTIVAMADTIASPMLRALRRNRSSVFSSDDDGHEKFPASGYDNGSLGSTTKMQLRRQDTEVAMMEISDTYEIVEETASHSIDQQKAWENLGERSFLDDVFCLRILQKLPHLGAAKRSVSATSSATDFAYEHDISVTETGAWGSGSDDEATAACSTSSMPKAAAAKIKRTFSQHLKSRAFTVTRRPTLPDLSPRGAGPSASGAAAADTHNTIYMLPEDEADEVFTASGLELLSRMASDTDPCVGGTNVIAQRSIGHGGRLHHTISCPVISPMDASAAAATMLLGHILGNGAGRAKTAREALASIAPTDSDYLAAASTCTTSCDAMSEFPPAFSVTTKASGTSPALGRSSCEQSDGQPDLAEDETEQLEHAPCSPYTAFREPNSIGPGMGWSDQHESAAADHSQYLQYGQVIDPVTGVEKLEQALDNATGQYTCYGFTPEHLSQQQQCRTSETDTDDVDNTYNVYGEQPREVTASSSFSQRSAGGGEEDDDGNELSYTEVRSTHGNKKMLSARSSSSRVAIPLLSTSTAASSGFHRDKRSSLPPCCSGTDIGYSMYGPSSLEAMAAADQPPVARGKHSSLPTRHKRVRVRQSSLCEETLHSQERCQLTTLADTASSSGAALGSPSNSLNELDRGIQEHSRLPSSTELHLRGIAARIDNTPGAILESAANHGDNFANASAADGQQTHSNFPPASQNKRRTSSPAVVVPIASTAAGSPSAFSQWDLLSITPPPTAAAPLPDGQSSATNAGEGNAENEAEEDKLYIDFNPIRGPASAAAAT
eukprot:scpid18602/ scgid3806/ 